MSNSVLFSEKLLNAEKIIVGLSGGADSIALTHILFSQFGGDKLICAHVNHGIRGEEADRDEEFVRDFCRKYSIKLAVKKVNVPEIAASLSIGTEECGRKLRYEFFDSLVTSPSDLIATAHNADDNGETVLLNLARGTGLKGLCGIPSVRGNIIRPILNMSRAQIEEYCKVHSLAYVTDSSNNSDDYDRNKVRHRVLSSLKGLNSKTVENITRTTELLAVDNDYLECSARAELEKSRVKYGLDAVKLRSLHLALLTRVLIIFLAEFGLTRPENKHIAAAVDAVYNKKSVTLPPDIQLEVRQDTLCVKQNSFTQFRRISMENNKEIAIFFIASISFYKRKFSKFRLEKIFFL